MLCVKRSNRFGATNIPAVSCSGARRRACLSLRAVLAVAAYSFLGDVMSENSRLVVFGCGYWGRNHVRTLAELGILAGVVDQDEASARALAEKHNVSVLTAETVFADQSINAVVLALPAQFHAQMALDAIASDKHVFVEKPMALTINDAQAMVDAAAKAGKILMTGHILRYHNAFAAVMKLVEDGELGDIKYVQSHRLGFGKFHMKFDALWDLAPHDLSLLLSVLGQAPESVQMVPVSVTNDQTDCAHVHFGFGGGVKGHIYVSRHSPYVERRFTVIGTKAMAVWDDMEADWNKKVSVHKHNVSRNEMNWTFSKQDPVYIACEAGMALTDELEHFLDCIKTGKKPLTDGTQGLDVVRILNQAR